VKTFVDQIIAVGGYAVQDGAGFVYRQINAGEGDHKSDKAAPSSHRRDPCYHDRSEAVRPIYCRPEAPISAFQYHPSPDQCHAFQMSRGTSQY
jgi:hypothetical protein